MIKRIGWYIVLGIALSSCAKKKYALLCPGEQRAPLTKEISPKHRETIEAHLATQRHEIAVVSGEVAPQKEVISKTSPAQAPREETRKTSEPEKKVAEHLPIPDTDDDDDEERKRVAHRPSLWAFNMFFSFTYLGAFGLPLYFIGLIWAIRNLFYLRSRKDEFSWKGFSVTIVIGHMLMTLLVGLILFAAMGAYPVVLDGAALAALSLLGFGFMLCVVALVFYFAEIELYSQRR